MYKGEEDKIRELKLRQIRLMTALGRAEIRKFTDIDWSGFAGAEGDAHMVDFLASDVWGIMNILKIEHWDPRGLVVVLDDSGLTFNYMDDRAFAYQVVLSLNCECWDAELVPEGEK